MTNTNRYQLQQPEVIQDPFGGVMYQHDQFPVSIILDHLGLDVATLDGRLLELQRTGSDGAEYYHRAVLRKPV